MDLAETFEAHRPVLFAIAYRMLGSVMDAEDILQEAFLRWQQAAAHEVQAPRAFLTTVVTRLCIDHLRSARVQREAYVGPWLPEPLLTEGEPDPTRQVELAESLSMAFLTLMERLTPTERAAFLLHDIFAFSFEEVAAILGKSPAACRQLARRARTHLTTERPRIRPPTEQQEQLAESFLRACLDGDLPGLLTTLADDVTLWSDGGGKVAAARQPIQGAPAVARFLVSIVRQVPPPIVPRLAGINEQPGIVVDAGGRLVGALVLDMAGEAITGVRIIVNPDKLRALARRLHLRVDPEVTG